MPLLSRRAVNDSTPMIRMELAKLTSMLTKASQTKEIVDIPLIFLAFTTDVAGQYLLQHHFGMQDDLNGKALAWKRAIHQIAGLTPIVKQFSWLTEAINLLPTSAWRRLSPDVACLLDLDATVMADAKRFLRACSSSQDQTAGRGPRAGGEKDGSRPASIFHAIWRQAGSLSERSIRRLFDEAKNVVVAGSETSARVLTRAVFELANHPDVLSHLRKDLSAAETALGRSTCEMSWAELEHIPWLTAVVKELLRITSVLTSRLPLQPHEALPYREWIIPAMVRPPHVSPSYLATELISLQTPVSLSPYDVLRDPAIFPDPEAFRPQRWLRDGDDGRLVSHPELDKYLVAFGKGPRMCQGLK